MALTMKKNCNRCKAICGDTGTCSLGFHAKDNTPQEPCPKPMTAAALESLLAERNGVEEKGVGSAKDATAGECKGQSIKMYLIDTENVGKAFIPLVLQNEANAKYLLFCTPNSPTVPLAIFPTLSKAFDRMEFIECCATGHNALDFQLSSLLGYILNTEPENQYVIVSKDSGFDAIVKFWKERGYQVTRQLPPTQEQTTAQNAADAKYTSPRCFEQYREQLIHNGNAPELAEEIAALIAKNIPKTNSKSSIHTAFLQHFGQDEGIRVYHKNKNLIDAWCKAGPLTETTDSNKGALWGKGA